MKAIALGVLCSFLSLMAEPPAAEPDDKDPLIIHNRNIIKVERRDPRDCSSCVGTEFKACMKFLTKEDFVTNVNKLNPRACKAYVHELNGPEMVEIFKMFTQQEWHALPPAFADTMIAHFNAEKERAVDQFYEKLLALLVNINALSQN